MKNQTISLWQRGEGGAVIVREVLPSDSRLTTRSQTSLVSIRSSSPNQMS